MAYGLPALAADQDAPTNGELTIEGDSAVFLQSQNRIEYSGNVIAYMDGMRISGDKVLVPTVSAARPKEGDALATAVMAAGSKS